VTKLSKGFGEFLDARLVNGITPRLYGAQADGCAPIVRLVERGDDVIQPVRPNTIAKSLAIGNPADGRSAARAIHSSGGWAASVDDVAIVAGIRLLAETTGIFGETAAGVTVAAAQALARDGKLSPDDEVVLCITGNGLKTTDAVATSLEIAEPIAPRLAEFAKLIQD
jgi:threonine synthase